MLGILRPNRDFSRGCGRCGASPFLPCSLYDRGSPAGAPTGLARSEMPQVAIRSHHKPDCSACSDYPQEIVAQIVWAKELERLRRLRRSGSSGCRVDQEADRATWNVHWRGRRQRRRSRGRDVYPPDARQICRNYECNGATFEQRLELSSFRETCIPEDVPDEIRHGCCVACLFYYGRQCSRLLRGGRVPRRLRPPSPCRRRGHAEAGRRGCGRAALPHHRWQARLPVTQPAVLLRATSCSGQAQRSCR